MDKNQILDKIKKLLSLATSDNENEAKLAAERAQEMLVRHNLSMQQVEMKDEYAEASVEEIGNLKAHHAMVITIVNKFFFVNVFMKGEYMGQTPGGRAKINRTITMYGTEANVEIAKYVYGYLITTYQRLWAEHKAQTGLDRSQHLSAQKSYYRGLTAGLTEKLESARAKVQTETGLVVVRDPKLQAQLRGMKTHKCQGGRHDAEAYSSGCEAGKNINISRPLGSTVGFGGQYLASGK